MIAVMAQAGHGVVQEALAGLIHQFADPLACLRELVQNAVDAGSTEIDVRFGHEDGRLVIDVDDYGEGMDRRSIDTRLTRLFSSSKEDDRTKIGRFGIGFVSVFALEPDVVRIDTSRAGEHWRVIFKPDRTFTRVARQAPVDGTKIRIYKAMAADEARALAERARAAIAFWCRHVPAEIRVDGRSIQEPFAVPELCAVTAEVGELRLAAGYCREGAGSVSYYNRGLTLLAEPAAEFPGVHLKLWSPALEHTMTRDNVLRDAAHGRALDHGRALVAGALRERLLATLEQSAPRVHRPGEATEHLYGALARHLAAGDTLPRGAKQRPIVRLIDGATVGLQALAQAARRGTLWSATTASRVATQLVARGDRVVAAAPGAAVLALLQQMTGASVQCADAVFCSATPLPAARRPPAWPKLQRALRELARVTTPIAGVELADLDELGAPATRVAIAQDEPGGLTLRAEVGRLAPTRCLMLHAAHPAVVAALSLADREPELAAAGLLKIVWLDDQDLSTARAGLLAAATMELRCRRTT